MLLLRVLLLAFIVLLKNKHTLLAENGENLRFSNLTILNTHKQRTCSCLVAVASEFVALNDNRKANFGPSENPSSKCPADTPLLHMLGLAPKSIHLILV